MIPVSKILLTVLASVSVLRLWKFLQLVYHHQFVSPIRHLRGPKGTSWIYGNMREALNPESSVLYEEWIKQYGSTLKYNGFFGSNQLLTMDTRAIHHVLTHSSDYQKPEQVRYLLSQIAGNGVLVAEGAHHRQQRHILNPAFGPAQIRELTDIFFDKSIKLRDVLSSEVAKDPAGSTSGARLDVVPWLGRMTLDVIGLAGFNYVFDALNANEKPNELNEAFQVLFAGGPKLGLFNLLQARVPILRMVPSNHARGVQSAQRTMARIGRELVSSAKAAAVATATKKGEIEKNSLQGRDLLSLLVKANMATDIPESQRLSDEEVLAQVPTFLVAGHETTSTATSWALFALSKAPEVQAKLRRELFSIDTDTPSMDELMALPYLDAVVRETLRVHSPIPDALRVAMKDDVLPVEKPFMDKYGVAHDSISIGKGDSILIPIWAINRSYELWGPDAHDFKPERWENTLDAITHIPGVWSHLLSFLGGPRACIGYRFSLVEMKAILFTLVRAFEFGLAVPANEIGRKRIVVQRPVHLKSDPERPQLPLMVKPYRQA